MAHISKLLPFRPETTISTLGVPANTALASSALTCSDWTTFQTDFQGKTNPGLLEMVEAAQVFAHNLATPLARPQWLSLLGSSGAGKTMLAKMILNDARAFVERHPYLEDGVHIRRVRFATWPKLANRLRNGDFDAMDEFERAWLVVIDDIGAEHDARSSFIPSKLYDLLNARLGKWTVLTSNFGMEQIADRLDTRIASRMRRDGARIVEVQVKDFATR